MLSSRASGSWCPASLRTPTVAHEDGHPGARPRGADAVRRGSPTGARGLEARAPAAPRGNGGLRRRVRRWAPGSPGASRPCSHGSCTAPPSIDSSSGTQRRTYAPSGSNRRPWRVGLKTRFGRVSAPVPATHCQFPTLFATSPSTRCSAKCAAPRRQSRYRCFARNDAVTNRARFGIVPSARSCRIPASTSG